MRTLRLLWGMTVRGVGWTLPIGALLGALYSMVVLGLLFFLARLSAGSTQPAPPIAVVLSMEIVLGIGGAIVGGLIGLAFGPLGGLFFAIMTRLFFGTSFDEPRYDRAAGWTGAGYGAAATLIGLWVISGFNVPPPTGAAQNALIFYALPALIGAAAGLFISQQIAEWFKEARTKRAAQGPGGTVAPVRAATS